MISDEMAYREYLEGREESADILVDRYGDALTYYINGYIHDIHESEDLMIEAFARVFAKERPIDGKGSFRAYLYKTARNLTIRHTQNISCGFCIWMRWILNCRVKNWWRQGFCKMRGKSVFMRQWRS